MAWTAPKSWTDAEAKGVPHTWWWVAGLVAIASGVSYAVGAGYISLAALGLFLFGAWTTPKTWTAVVVTVSDLNTHIRDNLNVLKTSINDDGTLHGCARLLDYSTTQTTIVSTASETSIYSKSVTGNTIGSSGLLRLTIDGLYLNATGSDKDFYVRVTFGGTTIAGSSSTIIATNSSASTHRTYRIVVQIKNLGATNSQNTLTAIAGGGASATETDWTAADFYKLATKTGLTLDTTAAQTLEALVKHSASSASLYFIMRSATLELITP